MKSLSKENLVENLLELIKRTSTRMPADVVAALKSGFEKEEKGSVAYNTLDFMLQNIEEAEKNNAPLCQDTGTVIVYVKHDSELDKDMFRDSFYEALRKATKQNYLRPNTVDPITGINSGDNTGDGVPFFHFEEKKTPGIEVKLMLKGGGCENVSTQYSLPDNDLKAGRDMDGIRKAIIDSVVQAQGFGCPPGTLGVGIGGDRMSSYILAKEQLFRPIHDKNSNPKLAELEEKLKEELNILGIGPMGFGGMTSVLAVKVGSMMRHPASFFVSIQYMCWSYRKKQLIWENEEPVIKDIE